MSTPGSGLASKRAMSPGPTVVGTQALASGQELSKDQIRLLNEQGYLSLSAITSADEVAEIRMALQELFDKKAGENEGANLDFVAGDDPEAPRTAPQILNPANYSPKLRKTACFKNALKIAKQALGDDARCFFDLTIMKLPHVGAATPWHQDVAFRDPRFEYSEMTVWVALQDVPVLPHHSMNDDPTSHAYECIGKFDQSAAVACPLPTGACTIHLPGTLHSAGPNTSNTARLAYIMVFGVAPKPAKSPQDFPWLEQKQTPAQAKKKQWMRRGGVFITVWRRLRRGDLTNWQTAVYGLKRIGRILRRGE
jgi:ectoine hydroxylase-related dioxygenase (phytanoyl-CoA dioxygenase family)